MAFVTIIQLFMAIMAAADQITQLKPGEQDMIDTPDVAFKLGKVRYDITRIEVKRAE